jgi:phenylacetate-CoA ligase
MIHLAYALASGRGRSVAEPAEIADLQLRRLRALVRHASRRVPIHGERLAAAGVDPEAIRALDDVRRIPTMAKALLRETPLADLVTRGFDPQRGDVVRTSGSTGSPLAIVRGPREVDWHRAAGLRILRECGFRWTDRAFEIRALAGPSFFVQRLGIAPKRWASILDPPAALARDLLAYRPQVVCATPSVLHELAESLLAMDARPAPPRIVIADAEPLVPTTRTLVARAFGTAPTDVYGLVELSNFAFECPAVAGLHVIADTHLVEVLDDDGQPAPPGVAGRIVVTDLMARTMPMLRYETGDRAALVHECCRCGRTSPRLVGLVGRAADAVSLSDGRRLHWPWFHETFARCAGLERYQVIQEDRTRVRIRVRARRDAEEAVVATLRTALAAEMPGDMRLDFERWDAEPDDPSRKLRPVVSRVTVP